MNVPTRPSAPTAQPRRVLFLARLFWPHIGGVEKHLAKLIEQLPSKKYAITIVTEQYDELLPLSEKWQECQIVRIPAVLVKSKWGVWSWIMSHAQLFWDADCIHIHDVFWWQLPLAPLVRHKSYITFHGYEGVDAPQLNQRLWHRLGALMTRANLCIGGFHQKWYGVTPTAVSFGAVDMRELKVAGVQKNSNNRRVIFLGRLAEDTGCLVYLQGFRLFVSQQPGWQLDVYGDGPQRAECQKYVKKHNLPVKFFGFVDNAAEKIANYQVACVSRHLAILEALAANVPVVAHYNNQIKRDYLEMSPFKDWITAVSSAEEVAQALQTHVPVQPTAVTWAQSQTWQRLAGIYQKLWS
jgi:glycosyltransferase involved in cell wall biosynthesis